MHIICQINRLEEKTIIIAIDIEKAFDKHNIRSG